MQNQIVYQRLILKHNLSATQILSALADLSHVVYLNNDAQPTIGLFADEYFTHENNETFHYIETDIDTYCVQPIPSLPKFCFQPSHAEPQSGFNGGLLGFIGYDFSASIQVKTAHKKQPALFIGRFSSYLKQSTEGWTFISHHPDAKQRYQVLLDLLNKDTYISTFKLQQQLQARWSFDQYQQAFHQVQDYIKAGDCYQINLTQEFTTQATGLLLDTAFQLWDLTDAPYAGYLRVGKFELLSCSPELFIDFEAERKIRTKPIKGTMPRYTDPILDTESKNTLKTSKKDMAENVMIVDLLRNDLSVYAEIGTVKTPKLFNIESFNQVHHMVSEIEARLKPDVNPFNVLISALPGGSITGAPKIRAMQIIEELEGAPRGAYCGSMGYFNHDGTGSWNILIRSIQKHQDDVSVWAGGGITIASNCDAEYQECFDKVEAMLNLLNTWYQP